MVAIVRSLRRNLAANFVSRAWIGILQLAVMPALLHLLGVEGFGLVGVLVVFQAVAAVLENACGTTTNLDLSQARARNDTALGGIFHNQALIAIGFGLCLAVLLAILTPLFQDGWISHQTLSAREVSTCLILMAAAAGFQIAAGSGFGALLACDRQVTANILLALSATLRTLGALAVLMATHGGVVTYFLWFAAVSALHALLTLVFAGRVTGWRTGMHRFSLDGLRGRAGYLRGMIGMGLLGAVLSQLDRIALAHWAGLADLGYYSLAMGIATTLLYVAGPVAQSSFPMFGAMMETRETHKIGPLVELLTRFLTVLIVPAALVAAFFGTELVTLWTGSADTAAHVVRVLAILLAGAALNALFYVPYNVQLATGRTRPLVLLQLAELIPFALLMWGLVTMYGATGAAIGWATLNLATIAILAPIILAKIPPPGQTARYGLAILIPLLGTLPPVLIAKLVVPAGLTPLPLLACLVATGLLSIACGVLATRQLRERALSMLKGRLGGMS